MAVFGTGRVWFIALHIACQAAGVGKRAACVRLFEAAFLGVLIRGSRLFETFGLAARLRLGLAKSLDLPSRLLRGVGPGLLGVVRKASQGGGKAPGLRQRLAIVGLRPATIGPNKVATSFGKGLAARLFGQRVGKREHRRAMADFGQQGLAPRKRQTARLALHSSAANCSRLASSATPSPRGWRRKAWILCEASSVLLSTGSEPAR